jgi:hypothetical protein
MVRTRRQWQVAVVVAALAALGLVACGGGGGGGSAGSGAAPAEQPRAAGPPAPGTVPQTSAIPDVSVLEVASGDEFSLGSIVPSERPVLVWFWAPH